MPTQPDSIDIEQLRAQLDAIYAPHEESVEAIESDLVQPEAERTQFATPGVSELTAEAKSHSPDYGVAKAECIATIGQHLDSLRQHKLGGYDG